jgi:hypothetical protein
MYSPVGSAYIIAFREKITANMYTALFSAKTFQRKPGSGYVAVPSKTIAVEHI